MDVPLIALLPLQLARLVGLVHSVEPARLDDQGRKAWVLLVNGRGFSRLLRDEPMPATGLHRPTTGSLPRPMRFPSSTVAAAYARSVGLLPRQRTWRTRRTDT